MGFAITRHDNGIAAVLHVIADMVLDTARLRHTAGRNDDHGSIGEVERLGLIDRLHVFQTAEGERILVRLHNTLYRLVEIVGVVFDHFGRFNTQGYPQNNPDPEACSPPPS